MKVTISVKGRFWAFYLARELAGRGHLHRLITSYPIFETVKYGVPRSKITSLVSSEVVDRGLRRVTGRLSWRWQPQQYLVGELFDRYACRKLPEDSEVFAGWSSFSLHSLRRAKTLGAKTVLERGSSHIVHQRDLLAAEYDRCRVRGMLPHPKVVEKELMEYEEADFISIPSQYVKRTFLAKGVPAGKLIHVPYGVDLRHFYPAPKEDGAFRVIFCGALSIRKGVRYLLRAFCELGLPGAELWLIGGVRREMSSFLSRHSSPAVHYKGSFPEFELHRYYSQGSVFCLPSLEEGLAMVQAQAMACGLPVVCTTNTGGADIVRDGRDGFIIPIRDVEALKEKILYFYEHPEACKEMGRSARERVKSGFTWGDYGERMVREYQRVLTGDAASTHAGGVREFSHTG